MNICIKKVIVITPWHHQKRFWMFFAERSSSYQQLYQASLWWLGAGTKTCTELRPVRVNLNIPQYCPRHRMELAFEMQNTHFRHKTCHSSMTCIINALFDKMRMRKIFPMFNVYLSGTTVSQGCNAVSLIWWKIESNRLHWCHLKMQFYQPDK